MFRSCPRTFFFDKKKDIIWLFGRSKGGGRKI